MNRKTKIASAIGLALGGAAFHGAANANLTSSATLSFTLGTSQVVACDYGTAPPCAMAGYNITDIVGSYFGMDVGAEPGTIVAAEKNPISSFNGIHLGTTQAASGSHGGAPNGSESPDIDNPWLFSGNTGMHQTSSPISVTGGSGDSYTLDMNGWNVTWNGIATIPLVQLGSATINCDTGSSCSDSSNYTLDAAFHVGGAGFTTVGYELHLTGHVTSGATVIPVPAAVWLFGTGLVGLAGVARRRKIK